MIIKLKQHAAFMTTLAGYLQQNACVCINESRGQEEAQQCDHRVSYLHVAPPSNSQTS